MVAIARGLGPEFDWLLDDTEESLLGASDHQWAIVCLVVSATYYRDRERLPWFIGNQLALAIPRHRGRPYRPSPDFCIHPTLGNVRRTALDLVRDGAPALVVEIASPSTAEEHDLDTLNPAAKPGAYAAAGIAEYLVYDPTARIIPEEVRAWRLGPAGAYIPWEPGADGRLHSSLGLALAPERPILRLYDPQGRPLPTTPDLARVEREREALAAQLAQERAARDREVAALRAELRRLRGE